MRRGGGQRGAGIGGIRGNVRYDQTREVGRGDDLCQRGGGRGQDLGLETEARVEPQLVVVEQSNGGGRRIEQARCRPHHPAEVLIVAGIRLAHAVDHGTAQCLGDAVPVGAACRFGIAWHLISLGCHHNVLGQAAEAAASGPTRGVCRSSALARAAVRHAASRALTRGTTTDRPPGWMASTTSRSSRTSSPSMTACAFRLRRGKRKVTASTARSLSWGCCFQ